MRKYGRSDLVTQMGIDDELAAEKQEPADSGETPPEQLADDLEAMGPTFVKLGQVLSSRPDLVPEAYLKALARLQDKVKPFPYAEVEQIVEKELGVRISKSFSRFDAEPIAGASLGQVHAKVVAVSRSSSTTTMRRMCRLPPPSSVDTARNVVIRRSLLLSHRQAGPYFPMFGSV